MVEPVLANTAWWRAPSPDVSRDATTAVAVMRLTQRRRTMQQQGQHHDDGKRHQCASDDNGPVGHGWKDNRCIGRR